MLKSLLIGAGALLVSAVPALACTDISSATVKLTACVDEQWQAVQGSGAQEFVYSSADQNYGLMVITEKEAFAATPLHDAILANAVSGAGGVAADVSVIGERVENIAGRPWNVLEYQLANAGTPILFQNYYYSQPGFGSVQILAYSLATTATATSFKAGLFASTVKLGN